MRQPLPRTTQVALGLVCLAGGVLVLRGGFVRGYFPARGLGGPKPPFSYPVGFVAVTYLAMLIELYAVVNALRACWYLHLATALVWAPFMLAATFFSMHSPGYVGVHALWNMVLLVILTVGGVVRLLAALRRRHRRSTSTTPPAP